MREAGPRWAAFNPSRHFKAFARPHHLLEMQRSVNKESRPDAGGAPQRSAHILIVEDDADIARVMRIHLEDAHYRVDVADDGLTGLRMARRSPYDVVILDLMLPIIDGLQVCRELAGVEARPLVLMVSARMAERDRVDGLDGGADDYLSKPFGIRELLARVRALLRRASLSRTTPAIEPVRWLAAGPLMLDCWGRYAVLKDVRVELTAREFDLLRWFVGHPNRIFSRSELLDAVWGEGYDGFEHTVNSHLNRLRSKLEADPARPALLITVRGGGYKLRAEPDSTSSAV
jgi:DNA-binding response OmpR family regulator